MALLRHRTVPESFESSLSWDDWPEFFFRPWMAARRSERWMRLEEYAEDGTLVLRADLPGIDPDKDVEISLADHQLTIEAERREEEKTEKRHYVSNELRYGSFSRTVTVPEGVSESDINATYRDGVLEVRIPYQQAKPTAKIPITKGGADSKAAS